MQNLYEIVKGSLFFNKFILNDIVCVEYTCPLEDEHLGICTQSDYIVHVLSGKKTWKTIHGDWTLETGDTMYVKKGAAIINQYFDDDFCMLGFFLPDDLIRESLKDVINDIQAISSSQVNLFISQELKPNDYLEGFFQSMLVYFRIKEQPPDDILKLKLKELLVNIVNDKENRLLTNYFKSFSETTKPTLPSIMEANFCYNLKIEEYAKLAHRSLSSFKRDFHNYYGISPGKWLLSKRLDYAAKHLLHNNSNITQIAFESGFEDASHFSHAFRQRFNLSPSEYRRAFLVTGSVN